MITLGVKTSKNIFTYPLIGLGTFLIYNKIENTMGLFCAHNGNLIKKINVTSDYCDMEFEDFIFGARQIYVDIIDSCQ